MAAGGLGTFRGRRGRPGGPDLEEQPTGPRSAKDVSRRTGSSSPSSKRARDRWRSASTGSPTPCGAGSRCSPRWPTPASTRSPRSCAATPPPWCLRTGAHRWAPGWPTPPRCTTCSAAAPTPCSSATTGGAITTDGVAATGADRWRRIVTAVDPAGKRHGRPLVGLRPDQDVLVPVRVPAGQRRDHRLLRRPRVHRPDLAGLVARLRQHLGRRPGEGRAARADQPHRREHLPHDVRRAGRARRVRRAAVRRVQPARPAHPLPPRDERRGASPPTWSSRPSPSCRRARRPTSSKAPATSSSTSSPTG